MGYHPNQYVHPLPVDPVGVPSCRSGQPSSVLPGQDALVCDPTPQIASRHLLTIAGPQNYGQTSYRVRQPFDFQGRTGTVTFDAEAFMLKGLIGWISVELNEEPTVAPNFAEYGNWEGGIAPRRGLQVHFGGECQAWYGGQPTTGVSAIWLFENHVDTGHFTPSAGQPACVRTGEGRLNRFQLRISQRKLEVWGTHASADGVSFGDPIKLRELDVNLPFSRGYLTFTTHNHASVKYSVSYTGRYFDAWRARWDNIGFDGPVITGSREYEVPHSLSPAFDSARNIGYAVGDRVAEPPTRVTLRGVDLTGAVSAKLLLARYHQTAFGTPDSSWALRYRFNGGAWRTRGLTPEEVRLWTDGRHLSSLTQWIDVSVSDLVPGDNTLEFTTNVRSAGYPSIVSNIELVLSTR